MDRSRLLAISGLVLVLLAVGGWWYYMGNRETSSAQYQVTIVSSVPQERSELLAAAVRVVQRRLAAAGDADALVAPDAKEIITAVSTSPAALAELSQQLLQPFSLKIMEQVPEAEAELIVQQHGGFASTGVDEDFITKAVASVMEDGKGQVALSLSPEGKERMDAVFRKNKGQFIGLFVRDRLMSLLKVESDDAKQTLTIAGIPSADIANQFADDVNVGLHVTFTPLP